MAAAAEVPGVESVAAVSHLPLAGFYYLTGLEIEGYQASRDNRADALFGYAAVRRARDRTFCVRGGVRVLAGCCRLLVSGACHPGARTAAGRGAAAGVGEERAQGDPRGPGGPPYNF